MSNERVFTPYILAGLYPGEKLHDGRALMNLSSEDMAAYYEKGETADERKQKQEWVKVTDLNTDTQWLVRPASCGAGCYCAAEAKPAPRG